MRAVMQMLDCYVSKYNFIMNKKISPTSDLAIDGKLGYRQIDEEKREESIVIVLELQNDISIKEKKDGDFSNTIDDGNINLSMIGIFSFDKDLKKSEIQKMISVNCVAILYQQMRAYITSSTALSGSVPNIVLPVLNFTND